MSVDTATVKRVARLARIAVSDVDAEALKAQNRPWAALRSSLRAVALYPLDMDNARTAAGADRTVTVREIEALRV